MIKTAKLRRGKHSNRAQVEYEKKFANKFELVKDIPKSRKKRHSADISSRCFPITALLEAVSAVVLPRVEASRVDGRD